MKLIKKMIYNRRLKIYEARARKHKRYEDIKLFWRTFDKLMKL